MGERTGGQGESVFVDIIGTPVIRTTLKALARCGVVATAGWKLGMNVTLLRAIECINRHTHVHTHYARYQEGQAAVEFAERTGWMAPAPDRVYRWEELPELAEDFACGRLDTFFPVFAVNGE